ncbi:MAG: alpha-L-fucosidase, partial [Bacteroidetes bacterium]
LGNLFLSGYGDRVKYAQFLHDASEILIRKPHGHWLEQVAGENDINLILPVNKPDVEIPVIELYLK